MIDKKNIINIVLPIILKFYNDVRSEAAPVIMVQKYEAIANCGVCCFTSIISLCSQLSVWCTYVIKLTMERHSISRFLFPFSV
jgi:hypothetical protein